MPFLCVELLEKALLSFCSRPTAVADATASCNITADLTTSRPKFVNFQARALSGSSARASLELELIQTQMENKLVPRAKMYARALRASQNVKRAEVWVSALGAYGVGGAWASAGVEGICLGWRDL
jgi:EAL domain-containing protein (putative c-di-GMP-specific phosphodiesterase class I)